MPQARAPATLLTTEVQIGGRPQRAIGQLTPQRLIHADALATRRAQQKRFCHHPHRAAISVPPKNRLHSTPGAVQPIRGSPPACCGRLLKRFVSAPGVTVRTHQRALPRATDRLRPLPPSPRIRHHAAPSPHSITARSSEGKRPHRSKDTPCSRDRRPQTADRRRPTVKGATADSPAETPGPALETPANPALECPSPRRRKNTAHASAGRFLFSNPRRDAPPRESRWLDLRVEVFGRDAGPHNPSEE